MPSAMCVLCVSRAARHPEAFAARNAVAVEDGVGAQGEGGPRTAGDGCFLHGRAAEEVRASDQE